jgi:hypothetical protein
MNMDARIAARWSKPFSIKLESIPLARVKAAASADR